MHEVFWNGLGSIKDLPSTGDRLRLVFDHATAVSSCVQHICLGCAFSFTVLFSQPQISLFGYHGFFFCLLCFRLFI